MQKKIKRIGTRLVINSILFSLLLSLCVGAIGFSTYYVGVMDRYQIYLETALNFILKNADGEDIKQSLLSGKKSEKYNELQTSADIFKDSARLEYLYIIKPLNIKETDNVKYVLTAVSQLEKDMGDEITTLGDLSGSEYSPKVVQDFFDYMKKDGISYYPNYTEFGYMYSAVAPIKDKSGEPVALAVAEISMNMLFKTMLGYIVTVLLSSIIVTALFLTIQIKWMRRKVVNPITGLAEAASGYVKSSKDSTGEDELDMQLPSITTNDELEQLHNALQQMSLDIKEYVRNLTAVTAEKERIGAELDVAKHIQASMLPSIFPAFTDIPQIDLYATMLPAKEVGGDFYDFFLVDDDHLAIIMADVSGKGVPAALFMVIAKTLLQNVTQTELSPKSVLEKVNKQLCANNDADMFVTVWIGILEISSGKMNCSNAGHEYPVIKRGNGDYELIKDKHGFVLAGYESSKYSEYEINLEVGDRLYLYTDGVPEATNSDCELFGNERMLNALNKHKGLSCQEMLIKVKEEVDAFVGTAPQFDDITMLCLQYSTKGSTKEKYIYKGAPTLDAITQMCDMTEKELESYDTPMKACTQINIAIDEIFSNIVKHSNASEASFNIKISNNIATLQFIDNGTQYDPTKAVDPDINLSAEERKVGGLGIFMVKKIMDSLAYEYLDNKNILTITKSF